MNSTQLKSYTLHLLLFVAIEIIFVFVLFREIPETNIFSAIGIGHTLYRIILLIAGFVRERSKKVWQRFLTTYMPVIAHLVIHFWIGIETLHVHEGEYHDETIWLLLSVIAVGVLIYWGELLIHRKYHCDTHHAETHAHCHDKECESDH